MRSHLRRARAHLLVLALMSALAGRSQGEEAEAPRVNYISADAVYLNVGRGAGLTIGARVQIVRNGATIAVLEVVHVSSHSASCRVVEQSQPPAVGDVAVFTAVPPPAVPPAAASGPAAGSAATTFEEKPTANVVSGYVEYQTDWQRDLTGSKLSYVVPAIAARLKVENVGGTGGELRVRDRIRYYDRDRPPGQFVEQREWYHRLMELAFVFDAPAATVSWGVGRLIAPDMVGIGPIDGGYVSFEFLRYLRVGAAGGLAPDLIDMSFSTDRAQAGGFVAFDYESQRRWRFTTSAAASGQYTSGTVSREFLYWQNVFNLYRRFSLFQSVEIDLNRDWRYDAAGERATFSNFYIAADAQAADFVTLDISYDSRQNVRVYETRETPDSLFDDGVHEGYRGGVTLQLPRGVTLRGYGGARYRDGDKTNRYFSLYARVSRLPWRGHSVWVRYAYARARSLTGHRPAVEYRFPLGRRTRLGAGAGGYIYEQGTGTTTSAYGDVGAYYTVGRYFASGKYRQYFGGGLESILLFVEIGLHL
jgi:hypothetical protein